MPEDIQKSIFSNNLNQLLADRHKTQAEVANIIGVSPQTFNTWCQGKAMPRMGKIQLLADYFGLNKSYLIEKHDNPAPDSQTKHAYYLDDDTAAMAQALFEDKNYRLLFDAAKDSRPEDLQMVADMLNRLKATNPEG